nr:hypothetical protein NG677_17395 [Methylobacterium sp. OTU13CASTA1]
MSRRKCAELLEVSEGAVRKAISAGRIPVEADGTIDPDKARAAWAKGTDPARTKVRTGTRGTRPTPVRTEDDARAAVGLIIRVLRGEGSGLDDTAEVDFGMARTADTILKAYERDLSMAQKRKELVPLAKVKDHVERAFIGLRQAVQRLPSRHVAAMAAELQCDPAALDAALSKVIAVELDGLSAPVVRV